MKFTPLVLRNIAQHQRGKFHLQEEYCTGERRAARGGVPSRPDEDSTRKLLSSVPTLGNDRFEAFGVVGGEVVEAEVDEETHILFGIDGPGIHLKTQIVRLLDPVRVLTVDLHAVVDAGETQLLDTLWREVSVNVVYGNLGEELFESQTAVYGERDEVGAGDETVFFERLDDLADADVLAQDVGVLLHLQHQTHTGERGDVTEVLVERGNLLAVGEGDGAADVGELGLLDLQTVGDFVMEDHDMVVGGEPDVDFGTETANGVGFGEGGQRVLRRTGSGPVTAVGDDFGLRDGCDGTQQGGQEEDKESLHGFET